MYFTFMDLSELRNWGQKAKYYNKRCSHHSFAKEIPTVWGAVIQEPQRKTKYMINIFGHLNNQIYVAYESPLCTLTMEWLRGLGLRPAPTRWLTIFLSSPYRGGYRLGASPGQSAITNWGSGWGWEQVGATFLKRRLENWLKLKRLTIPNVGRDVDVWALIHGKTTWQNWKNWPNPTYIYPMTQQIYPSEYTHAYAHQDIYQNLHNSKYPSTVEWRNIRWSLMKCPFFVDKKLAY